MFARRPVLSPARLSRWLGLDDDVPSTVAPSPTNEGMVGITPDTERAGHRYLFSGGRAEESLDFWTMNRSFLVLVGAGAALVLGFLMVRVRAARSVFTFLVLGAVLALSGLWYPETVAVLLQPAIPDWHWPRLPHGSTEWCSVAARGDRCWPPRETAICRPPPRIFPVRPTSPSAPRTLPPCGLRKWRSDWPTGPARWKPVPSRRSCHDDVQAATVRRALARAGGPDGVGVVLAVRHSGAIAGDGGRAPREITRNPAFDGTDRSAGKLARGRARSRPLKDFERWWLGRRAVLGEPGAPILERAVYSVGPLADGSWEGISSGRFRTRRENASWLRVPATEIVLEAMRGDPDHNPDWGLSEGGEWLVRVAPGRSRLVGKWSRPSEPSSPSRVSESDEVDLDIPLG